MGVSAGGLPVGLLKSICRDAEACVQLLGILGSFEF